MQINKYGYVTNSSQKNTAIPLYMTSEFMFVIFPILFKTHFVWLIPLSEILQLYHAVSYVGLNRGTRNSYISDYTNSNVMETSRVF